MLLRMQKGQEHRLVLSQDITNAKEFMHSAYRQATGALREIVQQTKDYLCRENQQDSLYGYSHNIIAFSGRRGQGKTSAMLSFSKALANSALPSDAKLGSCSFTVLPPIDPTILEENQSILAVILSRMYRYAEKTWERVYADRSFSSHPGHSEADKNELLALFQKCLTGINAIKFRKGEEITSLSMMQEISDSAVLKENFYALTRKLLWFSGKNSTDRMDFLVIQLDDTDFQVRKAYEVLEDIRKFLSIPNVIILMATDMDMLRTLIAQHYIEEFKKGLDQEIIDINMLRKIESKYIDKLIPPTYVVYLPQLDELIRQQPDLLHISYLDEDMNILLPKKYQCKGNNKDGGEDFSFQSLVLRYIYRKTGIVFAEPSSYLHNIIPTTLRGLWQLLNLLSSMDDVPEILEENKNDASHLADAILAQVKVLEQNLPLFEGYFLNDWVHTKLPLEKAKVISKLSDTVAANRISFILKQLHEFYAPKQKQEEAAASEIPPTTYAGLVGYMEKLRQNNRLIEDYYFFFAIHTFFTIQNHKAILRQKRKAASEIKPSNKPCSERLLLDLSPDVTYLPDSYFIPEQLAKIGETPLFGSITEAQYARLTDAFAADLVSQCSDKNVYQFNFMNIITLYLSFGHSTLRAKINGEVEQKQLYAAQESAALIAANWDVQDKIIKALTEDVRANRIKGQSFVATLETTYQHIDDAIARINVIVETKDNPSGGQNMKESMLSSALQTSIHLNLDNKSSSSLENALQAIGIQMGEYNGLPQKLSNIQYHAEQIKKQLLSHSSESQGLQIEWNGMVDLWKEVDPSMAGITGLQSAFSQSNGEMFWAEFIRAFEALCSKSGIRRAELSIPQAGAGS